MVVSSCGRQKARTMPSPRTAPERVSVRGFASWGKFDRKSCNRGAEPPRLSRARPAAPWHLACTATRCTRRREPTMSSLHDVHVSYTDPATAGGDPSLGHALERVLEAEQALVVRRLD